MYVSYGRSKMYHPVHGAGVIYWAGC